MVIHISGQVPAKAQNGMTELEEEWTQDPTPDPVIAVVKIARSGYKFNDDKQETEATMKFVHIEPLTGEMAEEAHALLAAAAANRPDGDSQTELDMSKAQAPADEDLERPEPQWDDTEGEDE